MNRGRADGEGVIFEMIRQGAFVRVCAVDSRTGIEASIVGPANYPDAVLKQNALRKLRYVLERNRGGTGKPP